MRRRRGRRRRADTAVTFLRRPVHGASLGLFRIAFGTLLLVEVLRFFLNGTAAHAYVAPTFHFPYPFIEWVRPWAGAGMYVQFGAIGALAIAFAAGAGFRVVAPLLCLGLTHVFLIDMALYLNHMYLICILALLMAVVAPHRFAAVDARRHPRPGDPFVPAWHLWTLRLQLVIVYSFGGIAKMQADWLSGDALVAMLDSPAQPWKAALAGSRAAVQTMAWSGLLLDLLLPWLLMWRRTRVLGALLSVAFHVSNHYLFHIGIFPWLMMAATTLFFRPDWPLVLQRFAAERLWPRRPLTPAEAAPAGPAFPRPVWALRLLALHFSVQVLLPLRHWIYPGNVNWTEEGHMFAWHMMLRSKRGEARFLVAHAAGIIEPDLRAHLTPRQILKMSRHPDMVHVYARHLAARHQAEGLQQVRVHALVRCALNGRSPRLMIDPAVDLGQVPRRLGPARFILPIDGPPHAAEALFFTARDPFGLPAGEALAIVTRSPPTAGP